MAMKQVELVIFILSAVEDQLRTGDSVVRGDWEWMDASTLVIEEDEVYEMVNGPGQARCVCHGS